MADEPMAIARVRLARTLSRVLAVPAVMVVVAAAATIGGFFVPTGVDIGLWVLAGLLVGAALAISLAPLTLRLEVEVGGLRLRWLGGSRRFHLVPGAVTRVAMSGDAGSAIRARYGFLGWAYGAAMLRGEERIWIVRLAPTRTVILVPTNLGRLAIAAASEPELIEALGAAARVQQRLDEVSGRVQAALPPPGEPAEVLEPAAQLPAAEPAESPPSGPRVLTGIERARLEAELAAARQAALEAAEAERQAIEEARRAGAASPAAAPAADAARVLPEAEPEAPWREAGPARQRVRGTWTRPAWAIDARLRVIATVVWALIPLVGSVAFYLAVGGDAAMSADNTPARLEALALLACGPLAAVGVLAARAWWPRLSGLVTVSALSALVLLARAVTG